MLTKAFIPYKGYYSSPFVNWQGNLATENSIVLGAQTSKKWLDAMNIEPGIFDYLILGITVSQPHQFYSSPWSSAMIGAKNTAAMTISQACTTGATCIFQAAQGVEIDLYSACYVLMTDRTSNGPHTIWPNPKGPGGQVISENWMMDNINCDPNVGLRMIETAENVAREIGTTKEQCDELSLRRYEQYTDSLAEERKFQKKYMFPVEVSISKKKTLAIEEDQGIKASTKEGLAQLKPVIEGGVLSFGAQTHPADANCGIIVTTREKAKELSHDKSFEIQVISYGYARAEAGYMAKAPFPAAKMALDKAGLKIGDIKAIKTHNPFIVNDIYFANGLNIDAYHMNNYGCSMIYGHPQGPTAGRAIIEGIEEVVLKGGGYLLWAGCAAGDTGTAMIFKIG